MFIDKKLNTITAKEYCKLKGLKYNIIIPEEKEKVYYPQYGEVYGKLKSIEISHPEIYVAEFENMNILGNNEVIFNDEYCIYDMVFREGGSRYHLNIPGTFINSNESIIKGEFEEELIEEGIMLSQFVAINFSHFMLQLIPRLYTLTKNNLYRDIPLIIDENVKIMPVFLEILNYFNKQNRKIIYIKSYKTYKIKKLVVLSNNITILPLGTDSKLGVSYSDTFMKATIIKEINKELLIEGKLEERVYISRKGGKARFTNELEVENVFREYGYKIINS